MKQITEEARIAAEELIEAAHPEKGDIFVVGCSSSEMIGQRIGHGSSMEAAAAAFEGLYPVLQKHGLFLAAQCCEHLNRAIVIEKEAALKYGLEIVSVLPQPKAGGSFATTVYQNLKEPVVVEEVKGHLGIDIGGTLIGMHLKRVAVPVRLSIQSIGEAPIICARTRPKFIGGARAQYSSAEQR